MIEPPTIILRDGDRCVWSCTCVTDVVASDDGRCGVTIVPCRDGCPLLRFMVRWCESNGRPIYGLD